MNRHNLRSDRTEKKIKSTRDKLHRLQLILRARRARRDWAERFATVLPDDVEELLDSMYQCAPQMGTDGQLHVIDAVTRIPRNKGMLLYHLCLERQPEVVLETGLAYGFSTVFLLAALRESGKGRHIAIDPLQSRLWHGVGAQRGIPLGMQDRFKVFEEPAEHALPRLAEQHQRVQFAFIDGDHRFDSAMMDFTLAARLCDIGAVMVLDDSWMPSIRCLIRYVEANRNDWRCIPSPLANIYLLEKVGEDERQWDDFVGF